MTDIAVITGGGGFQGLPVLRALHAMGWRALVADSVMESPNRYEADVFHLMPEAKNQESFRIELISIIERYQAKAVFPTTMYDLPVVAKLRPELEKMLGVRVLCSNPNLVSVLSDKALTLSAALKENLPVLPTIDPHQSDRFCALIGKPRWGWGGIGILRIPDYESLQHLIKGVNPDQYVWQRLLPKFTEWSIDFALSTDGRCSPIVSRRRLRTSSGFAVVSQIQPEPRLKSLAQQTAAWLIREGGCGFFNIQILEEPDGTLWLNDLNPRPGTSSVSALSAGINLVDFLLTEKSHSKNIHSGIVVRTLSEIHVPQFSKPIGGVVLDLDETLICQKSWMLAKLEKMLEKLQGSYESQKLTRFHIEAMRIIDEGPWQQLIDYSLVRSGLPSNMAGILIDLWRQVEPDTIVVHQDAWSFVSALQARNIPIALLSDNPAASQRQKIAKLPRDLHFKSIVLTDELSAPKPDTRGFLVASERISLPPEQLIMVGDSPWRDAAGAIRAGYAGALVVKRHGSMTNPLRSLFEKEYPDAIDNVHWVTSLYGMDRVLE